MSNSGWEYKISSCVSCPRLFYYKWGAPPEEYCPRCAQYLGRKRPVYYERQTDIVYDSLRDASEWLYNAPLSDLRELVEVGSVLEVFDVSTGKIIGRYTLERWLPERENDGKMFVFPANSGLIEKLISSGTLERRYGRCNKKRVDGCGGENKPNISDIQGGFKEE